jgi:hypothetical protein
MFTGFAIYLLIGWFVTKHVDDSNDAPKLSFHRFVFGMIVWLPLLISVTYKVIKDDNR